MYIIPPEKSFTLSIPALAKWYCAFLATRWVHLPGAMQALFWFMVIDYLFGVSAAFVRGELSSSAGMRGLVKKGMILGMLLMIHIAERQAGLELHFEQVGALGYLVNEIISIVENCARAGIPIPSALVQALLTVKKLRMESATAAQLAELASRQPPDPESRSLDQNR